MAKAKRVGKKTCTVMADETGLLETFKKIREALFSNDVQALNLLMAEEYVGFGPGGMIQDRKMSIDAYRPGAAKLDKYDVEEVTSVVIGSVGIVTGKGYIHGKFAETGFEHNLRFLDIYISRGGKWQLYLSQVTPLEGV